MLKRSVLGVLALVALAGIASAQDPQPGQQGAVKADSKFRPSPHGFNFPNWGGDAHPQGDLTVEDARCLFGDAVCVRIANGKCEPTPAARMWVEQMNRGMKNGHCEGLAALSAAFHAGQRKPDAYGGSTAWDLKVSDAALLRMISTLFTTQAIEPVASITAKTKDMSTAQIVDTLAKALADKSEVYTLGIYGAEGGHAITPYAVEDVGGGRFLIHVYDNNYPGAGNVVEVDTGADTWRYAGAALNPGEKAAPWTGRGGSMDLTPMSARFQPLVCPFCVSSKPQPMCGVAAGAGGGAAAPGGPRPPAASPGGPRPPAASPGGPRPPAASPGGPRPPAASPGRPRPPAASPARGPSQVETSANCDQVVVKDKKTGKRAAFEGGKLVSQIPGAKVTRRRGARGCSVQLPAGGDYDVSVVGRPGQGREPVDTTVFRPGQVVSLDGASVGAGQTETMGIGDSSFSYRPAADSKPSFAMATDNEDGRDGYYEIDELDLGAGHMFEIEENEDGDLVFDTDDPDLEDFDVHVRLEDASGADDYEFNDVDLDDQGEAILDEENGGLSLDMDSDADGTVDDRDADDDNDGTPDGSDKDDDGDGTPDAQEEDEDDADGDGTPDDADADDDNDGTPDASDADDDNDGTADAADQDDDNDGTPDAEEDAGDDEGDADEGDADDDEGDADDDGGEADDDGGDDGGDDDGGDDDGGDDDGGDDDGGDDDGGDDDDGGGDDDGDGRS